MTTVTEEKWRGLNSCKTFLPCRCLCLSFAYFTELYSFTLKLSSVFVFLCATKFGYDSAPTACIYRITAFAIRQSRMIEVRKVSGSRPFVASSLGNAFFKDE